MTLGAGSESGLEDSGSKFLDDAGRSFRKWLRRLPGEKPAEVLQMTPEQVSGNVAEDSGRSMRKLSGGLREKSLEMAPATSGRSRWKCFR